MRCDTGNHEALLVERRGDIAFCPAHPLGPNPDADPPVIGRCRYGHFGPVWYVPNQDAHLCRSCIRRFVFFGVWKTGNDPAA